MPSSQSKSEDDIADAMSRTKAEFWRYEEEYRIIGYERVDWGQKLDGRFCSFQPSLLCGITLGMSISSTDRDTVLRWVDHRPEILVYQAGEDTEKFWMDIWRVK